MNRINKKTGMALFLSIFILLAFSSIAFFSFHLLAAKSFSYLRHIRNLQAEYLALAARNFFLEYVVSHDTDFTDATIPNTTTTKNLGAPDSFTFTYATNPAPTVKTATMGFSGTAGTGLITSTRNMTQSFDGWPDVPLAFKYALFLSEPINAPAPASYDYYIWGTNLVITGDVNMPGRVDIDDPSRIIGNFYAHKKVELKFGGGTPRITGNLYLRDGADLWLDGNKCPKDSSPCPPAIPPVNGCNFSLSNTNYINGSVFCGDSQWPAGRTAVPLPTWDTTYYDNELQLAQGAASCNWGGKNFNGENQYCGGISMGGTINGGSASVPNCPVNIVASGSIGLEASLNLGKYINLICEKVSANTSITINPGGIMIYGRNANDGHFTYGGTYGSSILSSGDRQYTATMSENIRGIVYVGSLSDTQPISNLTGSLVLRRINGINPRWFYGVITYDRNAIPLAIKGLYRIRQNQTGQTLLQDQ